MMLLSGKYVLEPVISMGHLVMKGLPQGKERSKQVVEKCLAWPVHALSQEVGCRAFELGKNMCTYPRKHVIHSSLGR